MFVCVCYIIMRYPAGGLQSVQTGCEANSAPYEYIQRANGTLSLEVTRLGCKNNQLSHLVLRLRKSAARLLLPHTRSWHEQGLAFTNLLCPQAWYRPCQFLRSSFNPAKKNSQFSGVYLVNLLIIHISFIHVSHILLGAFLQTRSIYVPS
jgi:hypothetical protein